MAITESTSRRLLMESGGYCANPECRVPLFVDFGEGRVATVHEIAHIIAKSGSGPRGEEPLSEVERDDYGNLVLLCPRCHRLADEYPDQYPVDMIVSWKREHIEAIQALLGPVVTSRDELRLRALRNSHSKPRREHREKLIAAAAAYSRSRLRERALPAPADGLLACRAYLRAVQANP